MPEILEETLKKMGQGCTSEQLHSVLPDISMNGINNRLERLRKMGFLARNKVGRFWFYAKTGKK